jgi:hypothetical protein
MTESLLMTHMSGLFGLLTTSRRLRQRFFGYKCSGCRTEGFVRNVAADDWWSDSMKVVSCRFAPLAPIACSIVGRAKAAEA